MVHLIIIADSYQRARNWAASGYLTLEKERGIVTLISEYDTQKFRGLELNKHVVIARIGYNKLEEQFLREIESRIR